MECAFSGTAQNLLNANAISTGPLSMACWFYPTRTTNLEALMTITSSVNDYGFYLQLQGTVGGDPVAAVTYNLTAPAAVTSSGFVSGSWQHGCAVIAASNDRRVYLNGGSKGTETTNKTTPTMTHTSIASTAKSAQLFAGQIAEAAIWSVALTDAEVAILALGASPLLVQSTNLLAYWPLLGNTSPEIDLVGGFGMTLSASAPTKADHPRVLYPSSLPGLKSTYVAPPPAAYPRSFAVIVG